ncbi:MAG: hypothetical protein ABGW90_11195, partial [Martelella sp.]
PSPAFVTNVSLIDPGPDLLSGTVLSLGIVSGTLQYPVAEIASADAHAAAQKLGSVTRLLAAYCSEPVLFARHADGPWMRIDGTAVWGCGAAPRDLRLAAVLLSLAAFVVLVTLVSDTSAHFDRFARALRDRRRLGGPDAYAVEGPAELREIVAAVNVYLDAEREQLEAELGKKLATANERIAAVRNEALQEVGGIAEETAALIVTQLIGGRVAKGDIESAVSTVREG